MVRKDMWSGNGRMDDVPLVVARCERVETDGLRQNDETVVMWLLEDR
jgi:hypothetical protein